MALADDKAGGGSEMAFLTDRRDGLITTPSVLGVGAISVVNLVNTGAEFDNPPSRPVRLLFRWGRALGPAPCLLALASSPRHSIIRSSSTALSPNAAEPAGSPGRCPR